VGYRVGAGVGPPARGGGALPTGTAILGLGVLLALGGCGPSGPETAAERGRQVYQANCTSCHALDPAQNGPVGPAVKGSSEALLEARLVKGTYPPGYTPKRPSAIMQPLPQLAGSIPDLAAYLK
jgi:mono/diheme cytochrome c family protein